MRALATALLVAALVCLVSGAGLAGGDDRNVVLEWDESLFPVDDSGSGLTTELAVTETTCINGGVFDNTTNSCKCPFGFYTSDCSHTQCVNGGSDYNGKCGDLCSESCVCQACTCPTGWAGMSCLVCTEDASCQPQGLLAAGNSTSNRTRHVCDTGLIISEQRKFSCNITGMTTSLIPGGRLDWQCYNMNVTNEGFCSLQIYNWDQKSSTSAFTEAELLYCDFFNANQSIVDSGSTVRYAYATSICKCTGHHPCGFILSGILDQMTGSSYIDCNLRDGSCIFRAIAGFVFNLQCVAGQCGTEIIPLPPTPPPPPPPNYTLEYVLGFGGAAFLVAIVLAIRYVWTCCMASHYMSDAEFDALDDPANASSFTGAHLRWDDIQYWSPPLGPMCRRRPSKILHGVSGEVRPGQLLAIMGASGAGKTTLLDILANRKQTGRIAGLRTINERRYRPMFRNISGYVLQHERLMATLTVRETLHFYARLRMSTRVSPAQRRRRVNEVMQDLRIAHIAETRIGSEKSRGISGGEKKRVAIAIELVSRPKVLFLDEPTSGLDSHSALLIMERLKDLAARGRTIVFSIHQPQSKIFRLFDQLLLLAGGKAVYFGPARHAVDHFAARGKACPEDFNPPDFLLDLVETETPENLAVFNESYMWNGARFHGNELGGSDSTGGSTGDLAPTYQADPVDTKAVVRLPSGGRVGVNALGGPQYGSFPASDDDSSMMSDGRDEASLELLSLNTAADIQTERTQVWWIIQAMALSSRTAKNFWRDPFLMRTHFLIVLIIGGILSALFYHVTNDIAGVQNRFGSIFFMMALLGFGSLSSLELFISERAMFVRDRATGVYSTSAYFFSKILFDFLPLRVFPSLLLAAIVYFLIGFRPGWDHFLYFCGILTLFTCTTAALCMAVGVVVPSVAVGNALASLIILFYMLFGGLLLNKDSIPDWASWVKYLSCFQMAYEALMTNELNGLLVWFNPKGYDNFSVEVDGNQYLLEFGMDPSHFMRDIYGLSIMVGVYLTLAFVFLWTCVRERR